MSDDRRALPQRPNRSAMISVAAATLTLLSLCIGIVPIPFTGYLCFPSAVALAALALGTGLKGLHDARHNDVGGKGMAAAGAVIGAIVLLIFTCAGGLAMAFWPRISQALQLPHP